MTKFEGYLRAVTLSVIVAVGLGVGGLTMGGAALLIGAGPAQAQQQGTVPGDALGNLSTAEGWRAIRGGIQGEVSIPDKQAGQLVQSQGENWRNFKNGPLSIYGAWAMLGMVIVIVVFYLLRGRIRIDHGPDPQGRTIHRFNALERFAHWITASSFVVLALTGLNVLYGRYFLQPILGPELFASLTYYGKLAHNYLAFPFMLGIILMFVLWVRYNIPNTGDLRWLAIGGGLFSKGVHPNAGRFNAGQKFIFWSVVIGGGSLSVSGVALMWPFEVQPWSGTFAALNVFGFNLPTELTPLQETQLSVLWHAIVALIMIVIMIGHIYIGSLGMEGAFDAVGSGDVDLNWAKEHHSLWVEEEMQKAAASGAEGRQPAE